MEEVAYLKNVKLTPLFTYEKKEKADKGETGKVMLKIIKNVLSKSLTKI